MRSTFVTTLLEVAEQDPNVWLLCGDLGYSILEAFQQRFPERFCNVGVAEQNMAGIAAGLAHSGKTVFIYSIGNFPTFRCLEQLRNDVCYHGADVKVVAVGAGFAYGDQGYTHHALEDVAIMSVLPNLEIFVPCDPVEVRLATRAISISRKPAYLRLSRAGEPVLARIEPSDPRRPHFLREGDEVVLLTSGAIAANCLAAADTLAGEGLRAGVVSVPCLKPFDTDFVTRLAGDYRLMVTVEEHILRGGLHAAVVAALASCATRPPVLGLGVPEPSGKITTAGDWESLLAGAGLAPQTIAQRILAFAPS
jgi:transketolase